MNFPENVPKYIEAFHEALVEDASAEFCAMGKEAAYENATVYLWRHKRGNPFCDALVLQAAYKMNAPTLKGKSYFFSKWSEKETPFDNHYFSIMEDRVNHNIIMCNKDVLSLLIMDEETCKQFWVDIRRTMKNMEDLIKIEIQQQLLVMINIH